ncbi:MAG: GNAT family N-acetyltransferase [Balneola sp.]
MNDVTPHKLPGNIFMQPWWLNIVAPGQWEDVTIKKGDQVYARWPIVSRKVKGLTIVEMPILTQKLGPWIKQVSEKQETIHSNQRSTLLKLIDKLPKFDKFNYNLNIEITNHLPFTWKGFEQNSRTTFRFEYPYDPENLWNELKSSVRRDIRRAEEVLNISNTVGVDELIKMIELTFQRQGKKPPYTKELLGSLYDAALKKNRAQILGAIDNKGNLHAAQLIIHDDDTSYYLAGGFDHLSEIPGSVSFLLWNAIKEAHKRQNTFDFEGSSIEPIEYYFSSFGAKQVHFHNIQCMSKKYVPVYLAKKLINILN